MAKWSDLKAAIAQIIKTNGNQEITGQLLQNVLFNIVSSVGENSTFAGIATTTTSPGTLDGNIFYLAVEPGIYANFNGIELVDGEVAILEWKGSWAKINSGIASSSKISELGLYPVVVSKASSGSSALDLREIKVSLKKNSLLKFRVDISGSEISTYQMLSFYGGMHLGQTSFNIGEDYVLPLSREFNASTDIRFGAFIKNATPGTKAKFTYTLNYQNNPENPIGNEKLADGAVTSEKLADGAVTSEKLADDAISENNLPSLSRNFATSVELRKCGFYWNNANTGSLSKATSEIDGLIVPVMFDNTDLVIVGNIPNKYGNNVVFYSDYPSTDTYIGVTQNYKNNRVTPKAGSKYALFTIVATTPFKAFAYQSIVENGSVDDNKIKDASITFSKKIINPILYNAPFTASIVKEVYISKEDIPADAKDVENPIFCLGQILYTFGSTSINRIRIYYLTNEDTYKQAFGEIQTEDAEGNNAIIKFGKTKESYAKINFSELKDMGIEKNTHVFFDSTGKYPFINSVILNRQFSANSIPDRSIPNEKLETDLTELNNRLTVVEDAVEAGLSNTELFSIGDSLFAGGTWQKKTAEILNITFDQNKNADPSFPLSIGGTDSDMSKIGSTYFRVKNLVTKEYIKDSGENAIIVLENVNDGTFDFNPADRTYKMDKQYSIASLSQEQLNLISNEDRVLNAVAGVRSLSNGKKLTITALPTIEGDVTIKTGWAGPGVSTYNIHVIPQENDDLTRKYIIERIIEYSYKGIFDTAGEDGNSVYFTNGNNTYETTLEFTDTGKTGMACSVETVSNEAPWETFYWYNGENTEDENWGNTLNWVKPTKSSAWKSSIEELLRLYPKAHIFIANFPAIGKAVNDYYDSERGIYDEKRWYDANKERKDKQLSQFKAISEFYNIPLLDVWGNMNMSASNWNTFFPEAANVHPLKDGYEREGILIAALLKNFI
jgi:hypothetical protein